LSESDPKASKKSGKSKEISKSLSVVVDYRKKKLDQSKECSEVSKKSEKTSKTGKVKTKKK
jgi:hypothetical protein